MQRTSQLSSSNMFLSFVFAQSPLHTPLIIKSRRKPKHKKTFLAGSRGPSPASCLSLVRLTSGHLIQSKAHTHHSHLLGRKLAPTDPHKPLHSLESTHLVRNRNRTKKNVTPCRTEHTKMRAPSKSDGDGGGLRSTGLFLFLSFCNLPKRDGRSGYRTGRSV